MFRLVVLSKSRKEETWLRSNTALTSPQPQPPLDHGQPAAKEIARRFREDLWNTGDLAIADELVAHDCLIHAHIPFPIDFARGPDAVRHLVFFYHLAFTEIRVTADQIVVEGDT